MTVVLETKPYIQCAMKLLLSPELISVPIYTRTYSHMKGKSKNKKIHIEDIVANSFSHIQRLKSEAHTLNNKKVVPW